MPDSTHAERSRLGASASVESRAVERYLRVIAGLYEPDLGPKVPVEVLEQRIREEPRLTKRVQLIADLERQESPDRKNELIAAEEVAARVGFVKYAGSFTERNGITYKAWRAMGVSPAVLKEIGVRGVPSSVGQSSGRGQGAPGRPRRKMTPEFGQEVLDVYNAARADLGNDAGYDAVAERFDYARAYVTAVVRGAQKAVEGGRAVTRADFRLPGNRGRGRPAKDAES